MGGKTIENKTEKILGIQLNSATYGVVVPLVLGTSRIAGNIIDYYDFKAIPHTETQRIGKGGHTTIKNTSYTYEAAVLIGLAEGPSGGIGKIWVNGEKAGGLSSLNLTLFSGTYGQASWSYTQSKHPEKALPYSGLAYVAGVIDLGESGTPPVFNFEYKGLLRNTGDGIDVNPADAIAFICSDPVNGVGFGIGGIDAESLERYRRFCKAADLFISVPLTETKKAYEIINEICKATNTIVFWSQDKLKFVPKCDERLERDGVVYEPDLVPLYDLTADDFLETEDGQLVKFEREDNAEAYNHVSVEFLNRANSYEKEIAEAKIQVDINRRGLRSMSAVDIPYLHTKKRAEYVANQMVMESLYGRNKYIFRLGWSHCLLEPGDFVTIYDPAISPDKIPVTIDSIEEDEDGALAVVAKGRPPGIYSRARYETYEAERPDIDFNVPPGPTTATVFIPSPEVSGRLETWIAVSGGEHWGGCDIWISDNNEAYKKIGTVSKPSTHGVLTADLPLGNQIDVVNELQVELYYGQLHSVSPQDAQNLHTLCYVDGELMAYQTVTLTGEKQYTITYLLRGLFNTPIQHHPAGSKFIRLNDNVFRYDYDLKDAGKTIYFKTPSFNSYGSAQQGIEEVVSQTLILPGYTPPEIMDLTLAAYIYDAGDGTALSNLTVTFTAPEYSLIEGYNIYYTYSDEDWIYAGTTRTNTYTIPALPKGTVRVMVTTLGLRTESSGVISEPYTLSGKLSKPADVEWIGYELGPEVLLKWQPVPNPDAKVYEVRTNENFGELNGLVFLGDALSCRYKLTSRNQTFYIKALNRSGVYSANAAALQVTDAVPSTPPQPIITEFFSSLWIEILPVPDNDILGYNLYVTPCDTQGNPTGDTQVTTYPTPQRITYQAEVKSSFLVQVAAQDALGEGEKCAPVMARTRTIDEVAAFAQNIVFPKVVDELPELPSNDFPEGSLVVLSTDHQLYRSTGTEWDNSVSTEQLVGKITAGMIAAGAIGAAEIAARALRADHFAAGSIEAYVAAVQEAFIDSAKIINLDASKITVGGSSAPIPLAIAPTDTLFRFDGSLLSTQGLKPIGYDGTVTLAAPGGGDTESTSQPIAEEE